MVRLLTFDSGGTSCAATFYPSEQRGVGPCVVMGHGFTGTQDQLAEHAAGLVDLVERLELRVVAVRALGHLVVNPLYEPRPSWNDTTAGEPDMDKYVQFLHGQVEELLTNYGDIGVIWFDVTLPAEERGAFPWPRLLDVPVIALPLAASPSSTLQT